MAPAAFALVALFCVSASTYALALRGAETLLTVRTPDRHADIIVVLGGDGPVRARQAALLWRQGVADRILVTGRGDCKDIMDWMMQDGVSETAVVLECDSASTWENAEFSAPLLKHMGVRRGVLVTSWFHSRRAMRCFEAIVPGVDWMSSPAEPKMTYRRLLLDFEGWQVFKEYPKTIWYRLRTLGLKAQDTVSVAFDRRAVG
ncbi:hypothetical protein ASD31_00240 [Rhizobium sp. Root482]|nr:hypothetical protein ASD31_00240 [Rhizobium sp. Root482]